MARPKKETVDYFPHFLTNNSRTIFILEKEYKNDGYAFWFKLLEMLGGTKGHYVDMSDTTDLEFLAAKCNLTVDDGQSPKDKAEKILDRLAELEAIDTELWNKGKIVWCQNFVDNLSDLYTRRKMTVPKRPVLDSFCNNNPAQVEFQPTETHKLNKTKLNKTILNETKQKEELSVGVEEELKKVIGVYENEIGLVSKTICDSINFYLSEGMEAELIIKSIEIAVKNNKRRFSYCEGIIKNWMKEGIKTLSHYQVDEKDKPQKGNENGTNREGPGEVKLSDAEITQLNADREYSDNNDINF